MDETKQMIIDSDETYRRTAITSYINAEEEFRGTIIQTENIEETYPLKKYEVSYDIEVKPLMPSIFHKGRKQWKRVTEIVEATRFRDAKEIILEKFKNESKERKIKSIYVSEVRE